MTTSGTTVDGSIRVEDPIIRAALDGASETDTPEMPMAGPPGISVWLPMMKPEATGAASVIAMTVGAREGPSERVEEPITKACSEGSRYIFIPETVIAGAPATKVLEPTMN